MKNLALILLGTMLFISNAQKTFANDQPRLLQLTTSTDQIYPLGWSRKGRFAYIQISKTSDGKWATKTTALDLVNDSVLWTKEGVVDESTNPECAGNILQCVWTNESAGISEKLKALRINRVFQDKVKAFPIIFSSDEFRAELSRNASGTKLDLNFVSTKQGKKRIATLKGNFEVLGYIQSPFEDRIAILVAEQGRISLYGAHLTIGFGGEEVVISTTTKNQPTEVWKDPFNPAVDMELACRTSTEENFQLTKDYLSNVYLLDIAFYEAKAKKRLEEEIKDLDCFDKFSASQPHKVLKENIEHAGDPLSYLKPMNPFRKKDLTLSAYIQNHIYNFQSETEFVTFLVNSGEWFSFSYPEYSSPTSLKFSPDFKVQTKGGWIEPAEFKINQDRIAFLYPEGTIRIFRYKDGVIYSLDTAWLNFDTTRSESGE